MRHQIKSKYYYIFWGAATVAVTLGQLYVGTGYRVMADSVNLLTYTLTSELQPAPPNRSMSVSLNQPFEYE